MDSTQQATEQALNLAKRVRNGTATPRKRKSAPAIVTPEEVLALQAKAMNEKRDLQPAVMRELAAGGWELKYHTWNSIHSDPGFLDILALQETKTDYWLLVAELKKENGKMTEAQQRWFAMWKAIAWAINSASAFSEKILHAAGFKTVRVEVHEWRPSDWLSGRIQEVIYKPLGMTVGARKQVGKRTPA